MSLASKSQEQPLPVDGASPGELIDRGNALRKEGKHQQALEYFEQAAWLSPRDGNAWRCKADSLAMCFRYEASLQSCEKALEINPSDAEAWFLKSFALEMLGKYEEALESNAKSLEIDPGNKIAWVNKGQYLYALGRLEEAMESFGAALKIDPGSKYAKDVEDKVRAWMQREGGSDETIKQVIGFLQRGRCQEALKSYGDALKVDPREKEQSFSKDYALAHLKSPEKMLEEFQKQQEEIQPR
ncbi:MAG: tetratricopeptide repeat protein, partial [Chloroflexi bacterium]|nr:tetratricopeptide repeat protein [Chloroflexota bacterium]